MEDLKVLANNELIRAIIPNAYALVYVVYQSVASADLNGCCWNVGAQSVGMHRSKESQDSIEHAVTGCDMDVQLRAIHGCAVQVFLEANAQLQVFVEAGELVDTGRAQTDIMYRHSTLSF